MQTRNVDNYQVLPLVPKLLVAHSCLVLTIYNAWHSCGYCRLHIVSYVWPFSALTLLVGRQEAT